MAGIPQSDPKARQTADTWRQAAAHEPARASQRVRLGASLAAAGKLEDAVAAYREALALNPRSVAAYNGLGLIFASLGDRTTAAIFFEAALAVDDGAAEVHGNLANVRLAAGDLRAAEAGYRRAWQLQAAQALYPCQLGNVLRLAGRDQEAEACLHQALTLRPDYAGACVNLGLVLAERGDLREAERWYRRAVTLEPDLALAHVSLAMMLLKRGAFREGWLEQEWRWRWPEFSSPKRNFTQPLWRGEPVAGATVLLHAEQGFGDAIHFVRYVPMVVTLGARVVLEAPRELVRLFSGLDNVTVVARGDELPELDRHCPLMSLPRAFATELDTIPAKVPYLSAAGAEPDHASRDERLRVGLVWAGSARSTIDARRSMTLEALEPLRQITGVDLYSLQQGATTGAFTGQIAHDGDFADTAVAITKLDLVISVDTSVAHLAGALGKPVWILLPKVAEWRWLEGREDSPWYPTARLFRQKRDGDWAEVVMRVVRALEGLVAATSASLQ